MQQAEASIAFRILPQPHLCRSVREGVAEFARAGGVGPEVLEQFQTALGEALANAIEHGRCRSEIGVDIRLSHDRIVATVRDCGVGFVAQPGDERLPDVSSERGRGFPIMRECSDIFTIQSVPGHGTVVVIGRYLPLADEDVA